MAETEQANAKLRAALIAATDAIGRAIDALDDADTSLGDAWRLMGKDRADAMNAKGESK